MRLVGEKFVVIPLIFKGKIAYQKNGELPIHHKMKYKKLDEMFL